MRTFRAIALALVAVCGLAAAPASAQSLGQIIGSVTGFGSTVSNGCSYSSGVYAATCQLNRVQSLAQQVDQQRQQRDWRRADRLQRDQRVQSALQRACQAGDAQSCGRGGGSSEREMAVASALMDACQAGDDRSCARVDQIRRDARDARDGYAYEPRRYEPRQYAYEPRGYRVAR